MATVVKDFKIKSGLVVEGANAKVGGFDVLTKKEADVDYIVDLIGGTSTSANEANTVVKRDENGDFSAGEITADLVGNVTGTVSDISNHSTTDLAEGTNKYFTDQRALDATAAAYDPAGAAATAEANAISTASADATSKADAAQAAAESYADGIVSDLSDDLTQDIATAKSEAIADAAADATSKANAAENAAKSYTDTRETAITAAYEAYADGVSDDALAAAKAYTDVEVAALVDNAPEALDTLKELALALGNDENFATSVATEIGTKVDRDGDTMEGFLTLFADPTANKHAATKQYVDAAETAAASDATTKANAAQAAAEAFATAADSALYSTVTGDIATAKSEAISDAATDATTKANAAEQNAKDYADGIVADLGEIVGDLTTDDVAEGDANLYFTKERAEVALAEAIARGTRENIVITYDPEENSFDFIAENGVEDSTTDDLDEGTNNLYFTDQRAVDALEAVVPNFVEIDINSLATQVAASSSGGADQQIVAYAFPASEYRSAKFLVKVAYGTHTEVSEVLLTLDASDNVAITEYAIVGTNGSASSITADVFEGNVRLIVVPANNDSNMIVMGTLLAKITV